MADALHVLLDIQAHDQAMDGLRHRRATLPERQALETARQSVARLEGELAGVEGQIHELQRSQRRLEDEIEGLSAKVDAENTRLYSGKVTSPRELQSIQEEIDALGRRRATLEDQVLELMEQIEPLSARAVALGDERSAAEREAARLLGVIGEAESAIDAELATEIRARGELVPTVPADLLATYDKIRERLGGVAIARLEGGQCLGCHLTLPAMELDAVRHAPEGTMVTHEECGRILVHH